MNLRELWALPSALPLAFLGPLAWLAFRVFDRARARRLARAVGPRAPALAAELGAGRRRLRVALAAAGLALALLALAQPLWGSSGRAGEQRGVDLLVCLDVSRSMLARDLEPSRLQRAQRELHALAERARGDRLGLVLFAGAARLASPLTRDVDAFAELAERAGPESIASGGTDLGAALTTALAALEGAQGDGGVILLLTDGEDLSGNGLRAATECARRGIAVHCAGFGTALGGKIPIEVDGRESFLRDRSGAEVVTSFDGSSLRAIARASGGTFLDASARAQPLVALYDQRILPMARKVFAEERRRERGNRFQWPLLAAFALWMLELSLADRRRP